MTDTRPQAGSVGQDAATLASVSDASILSDTPLLKVRGLRHGWADHSEALFDIPQLDWYQGQHIWLQGANGSGKTTLMRLLAGLEPVQSGRIDLQTNDLPMSSILPWRQSKPESPRICYLHQTPYLFAGDVESNLRFVIRSLKGRAKAAALHVLDQGLNLAGLSPLRQQDAVTLSGGERQRLALLRAWLLQPDVLLLDEPTANLDDDSIALIYQLVDGMVANGCVVMVSSHQKNLLTDLCNACWSISSGTLQTKTLGYLRAR